MIFSHIFGEGKLVVSKIWDAMFPKQFEIKDDIPPLQQNP